MFIGVAVNITSAQMFPFHTTGLELLELKYVLVALPDTRGYIPLIRYAANGCHSLWWLEIQFSQGYMITEPSFVALEPWIRTN